MTEFNILNTKQKAIHIQINFEYFSCIRFQTSSNDSVFTYYDTISYPSIS